MPKLKTQKAVVKRFKVTKTGKVIKKKCGQDHFNAHESGNVTRNKRKNVQVGCKKLARNIRRFIVQ